MAEYIRSTTIAMTVDTSKRTIHAEFDNITEAKEWLDGFREDLDG